MIKKVKFLAISAGDDVLTEQMPEDVPAVQRVKQTLAAYKEYHPMFATADTEEGAIEKLRAKMLA